MDKQDEQDKNRAILSILCIHVEIRKRPSTIAQSFLGGKAQALRRAGDDVWRLTASQIK